MAIDPSRFHPINVVDTCSVWNILSSPRLNAAAKEAKCDFCVTNFVQYECLTKSRKSILPREQALMDRLRAEQQRGAFQTHSCSIEDLQIVEILEKRNKLGKGELSSIAFAMKIRQGFITDDRQAQTLAKDFGHPHSQSTPHLFSWLIFTNRLSDGDKDTVIAQHIDAGRQMAQHLQKAYEMALQCRLNSAVRA
ncbi:hypothetical protein CR155_17830 [Pollutimonas nitritireducens]|uniref:PIN domain-containing protein n=1 Tax=Pollutimonas nitritireducens TaxID=2045209 RepID=A0A2N4UC97_9BURK|nr:hypothetical protein [Pollutimonas nitritireducens]PLC52654.1 hypothetical protein CR155_17830 [Pollutimonas nitritireducens]